MKHPAPVKPWRVPRPSEDKAQVLKAAKITGRKVLWKDEIGRWHAATDRANTPHWATEIEDVT